MSSATTTCVTLVSLSEQPSQRIGLILGGFHCEQPKSKTKTSTGASSLRRTLSAVEMSSPIVCSPSDEIHIDQQHVEQKNDFSQQPNQFDIWSSIQIQKPSSLPPPYVHPLIKKSKSCLSLKSLEICTENLCSESGSDGHSPSVTSLSDTVEENEEIQEAIQEVVVVKGDVKKVVLNYIKKSSSSVIPRSFPPPLNSLSRPGGSIQMNTHRKDGRLVIEAVSVPASQNCFSAQRQGGRLVLTFTTPISESKSESFHNEDGVFKTDEEVGFECGPVNEIEESIMDEEEDKKILLKMISTIEVPKLQPAGVKFIGLSNNRNNTTTWSLTFKHNNLGEVLPTLLRTTTPPTLATAEDAPPGMSTQAAAIEASCFNGYEHFERKETSSIGGIYGSLNQQSLPNTKSTYYNYKSKSKNNLFVKDSTTATTKGGGKAKAYKEEKQNSNGKKLVLDLNLIVPAYCKPEPSIALVKVWAPVCMATS